MNLYLDIETLPTDWDKAIEYIKAKSADELAEALESVKAPANYKDEAKIAEFIFNKQMELKESHQQAIADKIAKTGLDGTFGRVCVIGWAEDQGDVQTISHETNEVALLKELAARLGGADGFNTTVVGHNVSAFDLRFLVQRFIVNRIRPPMVIARAAQAKPWEIEKVYDTMVQWAGVGNRISLEKLCVALEIDNPKTDITGATVAAAVAAGRIDEVAAYCSRDVEATRKVHQAMMFAN